MELDAIMMDNSLLFNQSVHRKVTFNERAFENLGKAVHRIKFIFLYNLWAWSPVFMNQGPSSFIDFVD